MLFLLPVRNAMGHLSIAYSLTIHEYLAGKPLHSLIVMVFVFSDCLRKFSDKIGKTDLVSFKSCLHEKLRMDCFMYVTDPLIGSINIGKLIVKCQIGRN